VTRGGSWRLAYAAIGVALLTMALLFALTGRRWGGPAAPGGPAGERPEGMAAVLARPLVWLQVLVFFVYTGLEATAGQWSYTLLTESRGVGPAAAGVWAGLYWGALAAGRVFFGFVVERLGPDRVLRLSLAGALAGAALLAVRYPVGLGCAGLVLLGFSLAPVFPCLMSETPRRLGAGVARHAVGFQVSAATVGIAGVPALAGLAAQAFGLESVGVAVVGLAVTLVVLHEALLALSGRD
jgi:fucose permease